MRRGEEIRQTPMLTGEKISKDFLCETYLSGSKLAEFYLKLKSTSLDKVTKVLLECLPFRDNQERPISQFFRGYLAGIFQQLYGRNVNVAETECIAKGDPICRFTIQVAK